MKYKKWKELRKDYSRKYIISVVINVYLIHLSWFIKRIGYFFIKFKHNHIWNYNFYCIICRKSKIDIDIERVKLKNE